MDPNVAASVAQSSQSSGISPSAAAAGGNVLSSLIGLGADAINFKRQKELLKMQNQFSLDMWNAQNAYNTPAAQLRRLQEAGFGGSSLNSQAVDQADSVSSSSAPSVSNSLGSVAGSIGVTFSDIPLAVRQARLLQEEINSKSIENRYAPRLNEEIINDYVASANLKGAEAKQVVELLPLLKNKTGAEIEAIKGQLDKLVEETLNVIEERRNVISQNRNIEANTKSVLLKNVEQEWRNFFYREFGINPDSNFSQSLFQSFLSGHLPDMIPQLSRMLGQLSSAVFGDKKSEGVVPSSFYDSVNENLPSPFLNRPHYSTVDSTLNFRNRKIYEPYDLNIKTYPKWMHWLYGKRGGKRRSRGDY